MYAPSTTKPLSPQHTHTHTHTHTDTQPHRHTTTQSKQSHHQSAAQRNKTKHHHLTSHICCPPHSPLHSAPPPKKKPAHAHTAKIDRSTKGYVDSRLDTYDDVTLSAVQLSRFFYVEQDEDIPEDKCAQLIAEYEPARTDGLMGVDGFARLLLGRHGQAYNPDHCETVYQVRACVCICSRVFVHVCVQIMCVVFGDVVSAEVCVCMKSGVSLLFLPLPP